MPRNSAGTYSLPLPPVVTGTTIVASFENTTDSDIATELTNSLDRSGRGGMLAPFKLADGTVSAPGLAFTQDPDNGLYRIGADNWAASVGGVKTLELGVNIITIAPGVNLTNTNSSSVSITGSTGTIAAATSGGPAGQAKLQVISATGTDGAFMLFYRVGAQVSFFGIDTDNYLKVGGGSYGNASYRILHEGNSFTWAPGALTTTQTIRCGDLTVTRPVGATGVVNIGDQTGGSRYLYYDGAQFAFQGANVVCALKLGVNSAAAPMSSLDVYVGATAHFITNLAGDGATLNVGALATGGGSWQNLALGGGCGSVLPCYDNTTTFGWTTYRWTTLHAVNGVIQTSDAREKRNVAPSALGLDFIEQLNPVSYQRIIEKNIAVRVPDYEEEVPATWDIDGNLIPATTRTVYKDAITPVPGVRVHYGLIAQDVQQAVMASGVADFGGYIPAEPADGPDGLQGLCYTEFIAPLVKAVQELSAKVKVLEAKP